MFRFLLRHFPTSLSLRKYETPRLVGVDRSRPPAVACSNHHEHVMSMLLEHTRVCGPKRCRRLALLGIVTAGDLVSADLTEAAARFRASHRALRVLKQYRRAIRFASVVPGMMPRDALLLISIHRRSARRLAGETPGSLHRDLLRFAESTKGQIHLRGRRVPSTRRLRKWIEQCQTRAKQNSPQSRAA